MRIDTAWITGRPVAHRGLHDPARYIIENTASAFAAAVAAGYAMLHIWLEGTLARVEARAATLAREAERAQLLALRSHLDPHFLFNTLNAIAEWCRDDGAVAERAVLQLSAMLRAILDGVHSPTWALRDELALLDALFELHGMRDPERVRLVRQLPQPLPDVALPPMLLLPLAENAIKHGVAAGHAGDIGLEVSAAGGGVRIRLTNAGAFRGPRPEGLGLKMVEQRLALAYEGRAAFHIGSEQGRTTAEVRIPAGARPVTERT